MKQETIKKYYKSISSGEIYFAGKDQKRGYNLINDKSGSKYFLPGFYEDTAVSEYFKEFTKGYYQPGKWEVLETMGDNLIKLNSGIDTIIRNANIYKIKRLSDGEIFTANNAKYKTNGLSFYITGFWYHEGLNTINVCGNYKKDDDYFSPNICSLDDLIALPAAPSTNIEQRDGFTGGEWFVDPGNKPTEILIRSRIDDDENFDLCSFECDETGNAEANAALIAQAKNMYQQLAEISNFLDGQKSIEVFNGSQMHKNIKEILQKANPKQ